VGLLENEGKELVLDGATNSLTLGWWGLIKGGTVVTTNGAVLVGEGGTLDAVRMDGVVETWGTSPSLMVANGLVLNGTIYVGSTNGLLGRVDFAESQTLAGNGTVVFGNSSDNRLRVADVGTTLTLGPEIVVRGQRGTIGNASLAVEVINEGLIWAEVSGSSIAI
jgi:hypothetical protein